MRLLLPVKHEYCYNCYNKRQVYMCRQLEGDMIPCGCCWSRRGRAGDTGSAPASRKARRPPRESAPEWGYDNIK